MLGQIRTRDIVHFGAILTGAVITIYSILELPHRDQFPPKWHKATLPRHSSQSDADYGNLLSRHSLMFHLRWSMNRPKLD